MESWVVEGIVNGNMIDGDYHGVMDIGVDGGGIGGGEDHDGWCWGL